MFCSMVISWQHACYQVQLPLWRFLRFVVMSEVHDFSLVHRVLIVNSKTSSNQDTIIMFVCKQRTSYLKTYNCNSTISYPRFTILLCFVHKLITEQKQLFLKKGWTKYQLGNQKILIVKGQQKTYYNAMLKTKMRNNSPKTLHKN